MPKKAVKSAVKRHLLKRRLREILRNLIKKPDMPGTIVVAARTGADTLTFDQLNDELSAAFKAILAGT